MRDVTMGTVRFVTLPDSTAPDSSWVSTRLYRPGAIAATMLWT